MRTLARTLVTSLLMFCGGAAVAAPVVLPHAEQIAMRAQSGKDYRILVATPESPPPPQGYPVVYVLDADIYFNTVVETMRMQSRRPPATGVLPALVVGIAYPEKDNAVARRALDYTPAPVAVANPEMSQAMREAGGADAFLAFIESELRPEIARRYATDARRQVLFGHSLGGLFVLHTLFARPTAFTHYVAASPSWWWNEPVMQKAERGFAALPDEARSGRALLLTVGEFEQKPSRFSDNMPGGIATLEKRRMVDNAHELAERLRATPGLRVELLEIAGENHLSSVPQAINRGLRFALEP